MSSGMKVCMVRHGETAWSLSGQFACALAMRWIGLAPLHGQRFALNTASVSLLGFAPHHPDLRIIELWNECQCAPSCALATH